MALSPPRGPSEKDSPVDVLQRKRKAKFLWSKVVGTIPIHTVHLDECEPTSKTRLSTNTLEINSDELQLLRQIGSGGFGVIHKAFWRGTVVACKTIRTDMFAEEQLAALEDLHLEVQVLQQLRHPNIMMLLAYEANSEHQVQIKASSLGRHPAPTRVHPAPASIRPQAFATWFAPEGDTCKSSARLAPATACTAQQCSTPGAQVMVSELMACSLLDILKTGSVADDKPALNRKFAVRYAVQLSQGMNYLHTCKPPIMHRDLKPENLLLDYSGIIKVRRIPKRGDVLPARVSHARRCAFSQIPHHPARPACRPQQVADFGLAKLRPGPTPEADPNKVMMTGETGSYRFMAPEVYRHEAYDEYGTLHFPFCLLFSTCHSPSPSLPPLSFPSFNWAYPTASWRHKCSAARHMTSRHPALCLASPAFTQSFSFSLLPPLSRIFAV